MTDAAAEIVLRPVRRADLDAIFAYEADPEARHLAAFVDRDPGDRTVFDTHWRRILADAAVTVRAIEVDGAVAGSIAAFERDGVPEVAFWLGRAFWGRGVASRALRAFIADVARRPLAARVAKDNPGSLRVLEKCGFVVTGEDRGFAAARGCEVEEWVLELTAAGGG